MKGLLFYRDDKMQSQYQIKHRNDTLPKPRTVKRQSGSSAQQGFKLRPRILDLERRLATSLLTLVASRPRLNSLATLLAIVLLFSLFPFLVFRAIAYACIA